MSVAATPARYPTLDPSGTGTLYDAFAERVRAHGERTFLVFEDRDGTTTEYTYAAFHDRVLRLARGLADRGIGHGDFVLVHLGNCPEVLLSWFALARIGAVLVPSNTANTAPELQHILDTSRPKLVITEELFLAAVDGGIDRSAISAPEVVVARGDVPDQTPFESLIASDPTPPETVVTADDLFELIFTSGTTSKPKAVMLTHANVVRAGLDAVHCCWLTDGERCLTALPMFHVNAQAMSALGAMTVGGTLVLIAEFSATRFWQQVRRHEATYTSIVAMHLRTILAQPSVAGERDHKLRRVFYAINVSTPEKEAFEERFGATLLNGYGLSEAMVLLTCAPVVGDRRWPSIGLPAPGRQLLLLGEDGQPVAPGEVGEIAVQGTPGRNIMLGYYENPQATAAALQDGVLRTGDKAYADERGFLYFFDRKKDVIKRAGENISAMEVESVLIEHPAVAEVAVVGVPDAIRDEAVAAMIVPAEGTSPDAQELVKFCRERLAKFKVPTIIEFAEQLPKTSIGKVRKDELRTDLRDAAPLDSGAR